MKQKWGCLALAGALALSLAPSLSPTAHAEEGLPEEIRYTGPISPEQANAYLGVLEGICDGYDVTFQDKDREYMIGEVLAAEFLKEVRLVDFNRDDNPELFVIHTSKSCADDPGSGIMGIQGTMEIWGFQDCAAHLIHSEQVDAQGPGWVTLNGQQCITFMFGGMMSTEPNMQIKYYTLCNDTWSLVRQVDLVTKPGALDYEYEYSISHNAESVKPYQYGAWQFGYVDGVFVEEEEMFDAIWTDAMDNPIWASSTDSFEEKILKIRDQLNIHRAIPSNSKIFVDGKRVDFEAYLVEQNNYIKLRDVAMALKGTQAEFQLVWDYGDTWLLPGTEYTPVGGELELREGSRQTLSLEDMSLIVEGPDVFEASRNGTYFACIDYYHTSALLIHGNYFVPLRTVGALADFYVGWDPLTGSVYIDTTRGYEF